MNDSHHSSFSFSVLPGFLASWLPQRFFPRFTPLHILCRTFLMPLPSQRSPPLLIGFFLAAFLAAHAAEPQRVMDKPSSSTGARTWGFTAGRSTGNAMRSSRDNDL